MVSGTSRLSFSENTPPDMYAATGTGRSSTPMIQESWWTMFSVMFPPENSQNSRQLMKRNASNGRAGRPSRNRSHCTLSAVQSDGTGRTHWPCPRGVLRLIHDSTEVTFPTTPSATHFRASANAPVLTCWRPIWITRSDRFAAARHASASGIDQVMVFSA